VTNDDKLQRKGSFTREADDAITARRDMSDEEWHRPPSSGQRAAVGARGVPPRALRSLRTHEPEGRV
jgi:hypothetical protein